MGLVLIPGTVGWTCFRGLLCALIFCGLLPWGGFGICRVLVCVVASGGVPASWFVLGEFACGGVFCFFGFGCLVVACRLLRGWCSG